MTQINPEKDVLRGLNPHPFLDRASAFVVEALAEPRELQRRIRASAPTELPVDPTKLDPPRAPEILHRILIAG